MNHEKKVEHLLEQILNAIAELADEIRRSRPRSAPVQVAKPRGTMSDHHNPTAPQQKPTVQDLDPKPDPPWDPRL